MILSSVDLKNFRNYEEIHIDLDKNVNIFFGDNAQGKTNILEAVYVGLTTKSHRFAKDKDLIRFGEDEAHLKLNMKDEKNLCTRIDMHLRKNKNKGIAVNGIVLKKASELFGYMNAVFFSPEDLSLIKNGPAERRKFIDVELCQLDKIYLYNLLNYNKILNQRNFMLKNSMYDRKNEDLIRIYELQMEKFAREIIKRRCEFINKLNSVIVNIHDKLSGGSENLCIKYEPDTLADDFLKKFDKNRERDYRTRSTNEGPHRDDFSFEINSVDIRKFGSQGQQRCAALSLKMSEIEIVEMITGKKPVLLLDDVLSELDSKRQTYLLDSIRQTQTLITCTGLDDFVKNRFHLDKVFQVSRGHLKEKK